MVTSAEPRLLTFAHSPDPDDAFMFYGFETGAVTIPGCTVRHHLADIQSLNERAFKGEFEITAVSAHAYAYLTDRYWALSCGASVGRGYGPILITRPGVAITDLKEIAVPGKWTTAALVLDLWLAGNGLQVTKKIMPFDEILPAIENGEIQAGLIIHEGQLTYQQHGLVKLWDQGSWWKEKHNLPLPLGLDVVRMDLGLPLAQAISKGFRASIEYAQAHQSDALRYALQYGRGLDAKLGERFVRMYVNEDTLSQGQEVQRGLETLYQEAYERHLLPARPVLRFI